MCTDIDNSCEIVIKRDIAMLDGGGDALS